jgi:hypothetical protein
LNISAVNDQNENLINTSDNIAVAIPKINMLATDAALINLTPNCTNKMQIKAVNPDVDAMHIRHLTRNPLDECDIILFAP